MRIETDVDWREEHTLLKYHVRTAYAGRFARYGCPFGSVQRAQVAGLLSADAMWEVNGNRWAAVCDDAGEAGLALITEAKYGFSCRDGDLGLSLLRGPRDPDNTADLGRHHIRFAVGAFSANSTADRPATAASAETLFAPTLLIRTRRPSPPPLELAALGTLAPSWVLPAETGDGFILRLHEALGARGTARLRLRDTRATVKYVDLMENELRSCRRAAGGAWRIDYGPYQIISLRIRS